MISMTMGLSWKFIIKYATLSYVFGFGEHDWKLFQNYNFFFSKLYRFVPGLELELGLQSPSYSVKFKDEIDQNFQTEMACSSKN